MTVFCGVGGGQGERWNSVIVTPTSNFSNFSNIIQVLVKMAYIPLTDSFRLTYPRREMLHMNSVNHAESINFTKNTAWKH